MTTADQNPGPPPPPPPPPHQSTMTLKHSTKIYLTSVTILLLAISLTFSTKTNHFFKTQHLKSTLTSHPRTCFQKVLNFILQITQKPKPTKTHLPNHKPNPSHCVLWMAPFLSGGGYSSEAWAYVLALCENLEGETNPRFRLSIEHHGDLESLEFWEGLPDRVKNLAFRLHRTECRVNETIVVCHSEPGAWYPPLFETLPCPPVGYEGFAFVIGRTMFETDRLNLEHVDRCNRMNQVWVPTEFHVSSFVQSGVDLSKVVKVVQPVDVDFFDPLKYEPLDLYRVGNLVLGESKTRWNQLQSEFLFLSVFKWEYRKGWDVLLEAYLKEFSGTDGVALYLLTNPYHSDNDFGNKIVEFVEDSDIRKPDDGWASVYVIDRHIAQTDLPRLYKAANAFVLPSRGEGWGRPLVEAMSMSLPVIATNWSGPTEYLTEGNGYPLHVEAMSEVMEGPFQGHLWAEPSIEKLRVLMRHVVMNIQEAKAKGRQARDDMISRFSPKTVAKIVMDNIHNILNEQ